MVQERFAGLIGQDTAIALLCRAVKQQRVAPAYLFAGPEGVGRRLAAERFTEVLFSQSAAPAAGEATLRRRIQQRNHPDLLWVEPTYLQQGQLIPVSAAQTQGLKRKSPPQIRLQQIREITQFLSRPPLEASRSVVVIEAANTMAEGAANGLLKTLEEPGQATIILLAPGGQALLPTLVSRCQTVPFSRLAADEIATVLQQVGQTEVLQHTQVMAMAQGSPGQAIQAHRQLQEMPPDLLQTLQTPPKTLRDALERGREVTRALDTEAQLWLLDYLQQWYWYSYPQVSQPWLTHLEQAKGYLRRFVQPRLVWEVTLMRICQID